MFLKLTKQARILAIALITLLSACSTKDDFNIQPLDNYNALWQIIDEHYAFLDMKLPPDSTWKDMYAKYRPLVGKDISSDSLFNIMKMLLSELNDGHVNLISPFDHAYFDEWSKEQSDYYRSSLVSKYLGKDYKIAGGLLYKQLTYNEHTKDSIAYFRYSSFNRGISSTNIIAALTRLVKCKGLIIDIRNNGGGSLTNSDRLASFFTPEERVVGYTRYKTGKGHNDFSEKMELVAHKGKYGVWRRPVVVLTDAGVYSAANDFVLKMKGLKEVTILGGKTGGGGGLPMSSELPNGWQVRYSSTQTFDLQGKQIEAGIEPDINVKLTKADIKKEKDSLIERAILLIKEAYKKPHKKKV